MAFIVVPKRLSDLTGRFVSDQRGFSSIEVAVMFGVAAVGFALVAAPMLDRTDTKMARIEGFLGQEIDETITGSISKSRHYTIRRSVLQQSVNSRCIIFSDGRKFGDC